MRYPLSILILLGLGCETIVEVSPPKYDSQPVVTSFFSPDSTWSLTMHRSLGAAIKRDVTLEYIKDASVMIMDGSSTIDILTYQGNGRYVSTTGVIPAHKTPYTVRVDLPNQASIRATSEAPPPVVVSDHSIRSIPAPPDAFDSSPRYELRVVFSDSPGKNFYRIGVYHHVKNETIYIGSVCQKTPVYRAPEKSD